VVGLEFTKSRNVVCHENEIDDPTESLMIARYVLPQ
jgi:hypothetical protein